MIGEIPGSLNDALASPAPVPRAKADLATGIPAETLRQRPDIRMAERRLAVPFGRIGFRDVTGETADVPYILKKFGMDAPAIAGLAKELVALK